MVLDCSTPVMRSGRAVTSTIYWWRISQLSGHEVAPPSVGQGWAGDLAAFTHPSMSRSPTNLKLYSWSFAWKPPAWSASQVLRPGDDDKMTSLTRRIRRTSGRYAHVSSARIGSQ